MKPLPYLVFICLAIVTGQTEVQGQTKRANMEFTDEAQIRQQRELWKAAFEAGDVNRIMSFYAPGAETLAFDILPPLQYEWEHFLGLFDGQLAVEVRDAKITASGDVAFIHALVHLTGKLASGRPFDLWMRATNGLRKINGTWLVVHDHVSAPVVDFETGRAAVELKP